jgi:hypothetical protein
MSECKIVRVVYLFGATPQSLQTAIENEAVQVVLPPPSL